MVESRSWLSRLADAANYALLALIALACILPMLHVLAVSLSDRSATAGGFVTFWPIGFSLVSYKKVLEAGAFLSAFAVSIERTVLGAALNMAITVLTAYPLSKSAREFRGRDLFVWLILFAMLFSGGLIPWFLVIRQFGMLNSIWALIIPGALPIWNVLLMMNFFREIPRELEEAAVIDGASHWQILGRVYIPLSMAPLATLTLFAAVFHWNAWFDALVLMTDSTKYPLQTFLRTIIISQDIFQIVRDPSDYYAFSDRSIKAAQIFVTTLPILAVYPLLQRYFIAGIRLGAIKG
ncbi:MAG TPA: carbohydrate ABC transporter permease [Chloroflexota bacterium]|jgi:putative aldouronate transport system permease protein